MAMAGADATAQFKAFHKHAVLTRVAEKYKIGRLQAEPLVDIVSGRALKPSTTQAHQTSAKPEDSAKQHAPAVKATGGDGDIDDESAAKTSKSTGTVHGDFAQGSGSHVTTLCEHPVPAYLRACVHACRPPST